jgi:hypothetical protein
MDGPLLVGAAPEPLVERPLLLRDDPERDVQPADQRLEVGAQERAPSLADVAKLPGERRRCVAGWGAEELYER